MFSMVLCCCFCSLRYLSGSINLLLSSSLYSAKSVVQFAFEEMISTASETDSDISLSDFSDSSSDEDTPLPSPLYQKEDAGLGHEVVGFEHEVVNKDQQEQIQEIIGWSGQQYRLHQSYHPLLEILVQQSLSLTASRTMFIYSYLTN